MGFPFLCWMVNWKHLPTVRSTRAGSDGGLVVMGHFPDLVMDQNYCYKMNSLLLYYYIYMYIYIYTGWWFQTCFYFPFQIWDKSFPSTFIFFKMVIAPPTSIYNEKHVLPSVPHFWDLHVFDLLLSGMVIVTAVDPSDWIGTCLPPRKLDHLRLYLVLSSAQTSGLTHITVTLQKNIPIK